MSSTFYLDSKRQHNLNPDNLTFALYHFSSGVAEVIDDFSDNDRDLTLTGYAGTYGGHASGYVGRALDFNGTSQYATIGGAAFPRASLQSGTIQAQVYLPTWRPSGTVVDLGGNIRLSYNNASGAFEAFLADGAGASGYLYTTSSGHIGDWNYLALQWSSGSATSYGSGLCKLYFDGEVEYTFSGVVPHPNVVNTSRIGARTNATDLFYTNARVDELAIDTFKTDDEIRNHYYREKELYTLSVSRGATHITDTFTARIWNPSAKKATKYSQFDNVDIQSRDNKIFTGRIENVTADKSLGDILILEGRDFRAELTDRYALESYASGIDTSAIVSDILNKYSRNIPNKVVSTTGHLLQGTRTFAGQSAAYVIYTLAREDNYAAHAHIHEDGTYEFHYAATTATDSGITLSEGSDFIIQVKKTDSGFDTINKATVVGATSGGSSLVSSVDNFDSQTSLGLTKEFFKVDQSLSTQGDVDKAAQSYVDQQSEVQYIELKVLLNTPNSTLEKLGTGELVTLNIPTHNILKEQFMVLDKVIDFPEGIVTMKLANYRKEIEDYLFQLIAAQKQKESENLAVQTLPKIINVAEEIKIKELGINIYDRNLGSGFVVGDQSIPLGRIGRVTATKTWTERFDFEQNDLQTNIGLDNPQGTVRISSSSVDASKTYTSQSDFETGTVQRNIDSAIVAGSIQITAASGDARWDGSVFDSTTAGTSWTSLAFTKQFTPASGDVGWEFRANNTLFAAGDASPSFTILGSGATPIVLSNTGRYGQVRSVMWSSGDASTSSKIFTTQSDFETNVAQRNITTTIVPASIQIISSSGDARWDSSIVDSTAINSSWSSVAFTKQFAPPSGDVGWEFRASNTSFAAGDSTPTWTILGSGATPITLTNTGRYGQVRSVVWASGQFPNFYAGFEAGESPSYTTGNLDGQNSWVLPAARSSLSVGTAFPLNGTRDVEGLTSASRSAEQVFTGSYQEFTAEFACAQSASSRGRTWFYIKSGGGFGSLACSTVLHENGQIRAFNGAYTNIQAFSANTWYRIRLIWKTNNTTDIYVDGTLQITNFASQTGGLDTVNSISPDTENDGLGGNITCYYDDIRVWRTTYTGPSAMGSPRIDDITVNYSLSTPVYRSSPRVDDVTINYTTAADVQASGTIVTPVWDTLIPSGKFDSVTWNRVNNSAYLRLSVRPSGTDYIGNWVELPTGTVESGIQTYDLRTNNVWGKGLQWKADLYRSGINNNPRLNDITLSFASGETQPVLGEGGGPWSLIYTG